jgi:hypothetical protein
VESLLLACNDYSKLLSIVEKMCGLTQAHYAVVFRAFMEFLVQQ